MKLKTLEQFGQNDPCECGGNCGCGSKPVTESKGYKAGDEVELKTGETVKINQVVKGPRAELNTYRAKVKGKQIDFSLSDINESIDEAKKYKFKELAKAWSHVYGEDMEDEYQGFFQEVTGKYKDKVTKKDIADIWSATYGEDIAADYDGFYNELKENLEQVAKLEELDNLVEANTDGTISDCLLYTSPSTRDNS
mgnify:FL=1